MVSFRSQKTYATVTISLIKVVLSENNTKTKVPSKNLNFKRNLKIPGNFAKKLAIRVNQSL